MSESDYRIEYNKSMRKFLIINKKGVVVADTKRYIDACILVQNVCNRNGKVDE